MLVNPCAPEAANLKAKIDDLALFGGARVFAHELHVGRPNIGNRDRLKERIDDMLDRAWLTNDGPYAQELEKRIAQLLGVRHCILTANATLALQFVVRALELKGEVILPSFTFIATAHALQWEGLTPVFCDIDPATCNIDPSKIEALITDKTSAVLGVHVWGRGCDVEALQSVADSYNIKLFFDAAHAFACAHAGRMIGNFGNAEVFSFHATKVINSFEGGAVTTNDDALAAKIRLLRNFGIVDYDQAAGLGINGKMSEASAAMGLTSLESLDEFIERNRRNYDQYDRLLKDIAGIELLAYDRRQRHNHQYVVLKIDESEFGLTRDALQKILWAENILARRYFYPGCHAQEPYRSKPNKPSLHQTDLIGSAILSLPTGSSVDEREIDLICRLMRFAANHARDIASRL